MYLSQPVLSEVSISPHGITMPNGLYLTTVVFSSSFFPSTTNLWGHWTDLNQTWTYIHLWLLFEKFGTNSRGPLPHRLGAKSAFLGPTLNFDRTYLCNGTWYPQSERNLSIYRNIPTSFEIWWTLVQKPLRTVGEFLPPLQFSHWETLSALSHGGYITTDSRQTVLCSGTS